MGYLFGQEPFDGFTQALRDVDHDRQRGPDLPLLDLRDEALGALVAGEIGLGHAELQPALADAGAETR